MKKKNLAVFTLGCGLLLLTGCGGNKLTCTVDMSDELDGFGTMEAEVVFHFDSDWKKVEEFDMEMIVELSDEFEDEAMDLFKGQLEEMCEGDDAPKDCEVKVKGNKATLTASGDSEIMEIEEDMTKEEVIEAMEDEGFTCK